MRAAFFASVILSAVALGWGSYQADQDQLALAAAGLGILWVAASIARQRWFDGIAVLLFSMTAAVGIRLEVSLGWAAACVGLAVLAWDLAVFNRRLQLASKEDNIAALAAGHLRWALGTAVVGVLLGILPGTARIELSFGWVLAAALVGVTAFIYLISKSVTKRE